MPARIVSVALGTVLLLLLPALPARADFAATNDWPEEILTDEGKLLVYQPQLESLEGDTLTGRAAISFTPIGGEPTFGAFWFEGKLRTDRDARTYTLEKIKVPGVKFPELDPENAVKTARLLEKEIPKWNIHGSLDAILPALELAKKEQSAVEQLRTEPPKILFRMRPSVLLLYDGKPRVRPVEGSDLKRAVNTPFFVVQDAAGGWYLNLGEFWYGAPDPAGTWNAGANPPDSVRKLQEREAARAEEKAGGPKAETKASPVKDAEKPVPPEIIVATEPTSSSRPTAVRSTLPYRGTSCCSWRTPRTTCSCRSARRNISPFSRADGSRHTPLPAGHGNTWLRTSSLPSSGRSRPIPPRDTCWRAWRGPTRRTRRSSTPTSPRRRRSNGRRTRRSA
jgi:hypothetical protein